MRRPNLRLSASKKKGGKLTKTVAKAEDTRAEIRVTLANILQRYIPKTKLLGWVLGRKVIGL